MSTELSAQDFVSKMHEDCAWVWQTDPSSTRIALRVQEPGSTEIQEYVSPDLVDMDHVTFVWFSNAMEGIFKDQEEAPKVFDSSGLTLAVQEIDKDGNAGAITYVPPGGSYPETQERLHPERWSWIREDENRDGVLQLARALDQTDRYHNS